MFGMGMQEILIILAVALIVIGPRKLPDLAKSLGRALGEFRRATSDIKDTINLEADASAKPPYIPDPVVDDEPDVTDDEETSSSEPPKTNDMKDDAASSSSGDDDAR